MKAILYFIALLIVISACKTETEVSKQKSAIAIIQELDTNQKKMDFLDRLIQEDQGNLKSKEEKAELNPWHMELIDTYIKTYGYPSKQELGLVAASAPWLIIHHYMGEDKLEVRNKYFPILANAHKRNDIDNGQFSLFLRRFYNIKTNEDFRMQRTRFQPQEEIDTLLNLLNLQYP